MPEVDRLRPERRQIDRRTVITTAAWAAPVVAFAFAAPVAAAATDAPAPAPVAAIPMTWWFDRDGDKYNDGYYDLKRQLRRQGPYAPPIDQNSAFQDRGVRFTVTVVLDNGPTGANGEALIVDASSIVFSSSADREWAVTSLSRSGTTWTIVFQAYYYPGSGANFTPFNPGKAVQNIMFRIPTSTTENGRPISLLPHMTIRFDGVGVPASGPPTEGFVPWGPGAPQT